MYASLTDLLPQPISIEVQPPLSKAGPRPAPPSEAFPVDLQHEQEPTFVLNIRINPEFLLPTSQPIVRFFSVQVNWPAGPTGPRETRYSLTEAGMTRVEAAAFRMQLGAFAEGWDE